LAFSMKAQPRADHWDRPDANYPFPRGKSTNFGPLSLRVRVRIVTISSIERKPRKCAAWHDCCGKS